MTKEKVDVGGMCPACGRAVLSAPVKGQVLVPAEGLEVPRRHPGQSDETLRITSLKKKDGGFVLSGVLSSSACPVCGSAVSFLATEVPVELERLKCTCGSNVFEISLSSIKEGRKPMAAWQFELDVNCQACKRVRFREKVASFFRLKKIRVGLTGINIEMK